MGIWRSRQTTSLRGNRFYRRPERSHCFALSLFRQSSLKHRHPKVFLRSMLTRWITPQGDEATRPWLGYLGFRKPSLGAPVFVEAQHPPSPRPSRQPELPGSELKIQEPDVPNKERSDPHPWGGCCRRSFVGCDHPSTIESCRNGSARKLFSIWLTKSRGESRRRQDVWLTTC